MSNPPTSSSRVKGLAAILLLLGVWGALVPYAGPAFGYAMGDTPAWTWTESRATLHLVPGLAVIVGASLLISQQRGLQKLGASLAAVGGIWFVIAPSLHPLWAGQSMDGMSMGGSALSNALVSLGYHYGTGALIAVVAAYALGVLNATRGAPEESRTAVSQPEGQTMTESPLVGARR